jgi:hypothetical protein
VRDEHRLGAVCRDHATNASPDHPRTGVENAMTASDRRFRRAPVSIGAAALAGFLLLPGRVLAVSRTCGVDPVANTTNVLCAAPSGPCTGTAVTMSSDIEVTTGSCTFDLGGRTLSIQKSFQITGLGTLKVINAGDITITGTGRLKSRGDFVEPNGFVIRGGIIDLTSSGVITLLDRAQIDVSGDSAGIIRLTANGVNGAGVGIDFKATAQIFGQGFSMADEGERYSDGGSLTMRATSGGITDAATIFLSGANQATGGAIDMRAARDLVINDTIDASGGGRDGGSIDLLAGNNIVINKQLNADSRTGGGYGGTMSMTAGFDTLGGVVPGGGVAINDTTLEMNGSDSETSGGDGGELDIDAPLDTFAG